MSFTRGVISGAITSQYLLEKSRIVFQVKLNTNTQETTQYLFINSRHLSIHAYEFFLHMHMHEDMRVLHARENISMLYPNGCINLFMYFCYMDLFSSSGQIRAELSHFLWDVGRSSSKWEAPTLSAGSWDLLLSESGGLQKCPAHNTHRTQISGHRNHFYCHINKWCASLVDLCY